MWKLKAGEPNFDIVDGPFAGRQFRAGVNYAEIPPGEQNRFEKVEEVEKSWRPWTARTTKNTGGDEE